MMDSESHTDSSSRSSEHHWRIFGRYLPKSEIAFFCQIGILYLVILTCIINLSINNGDSNLWTALLSSSLGYILPNPSLKRHKTGRLVPASPATTP